MKKIILIIALFVTGDILAQEQKLADVVLESIRQKNYSLIAPYFIPDSLLLEPRKDNSKKETKKFEESAALIPMMKGRHLELVVTIRSPK